MRLPVLSLLLFLAAAPAPADDYVLHEWGYFLENGGPDVLDLQAQLPPEVPNWRNTREPTDSSTGATGRVTAEASGMSTVAATADERLRILRGPLVARTVADDRRGTEAAAGDWQEIPGPRFVVRHRNAYVAGRVLHALDAGWSTISRAMVPGGAVEWAKPREVLVHPDAESFRGATGQPEWVDGLTQHQTRGGRLVSQRIHFYMGSQDLLTSTVPHELAHALFHSVVDSRRGIPSWIDEGVAVHFESEASRGRRARRLERALADERVPTAAAIAARTDYPVDPADVEIFYAASHSMVEYLLSLGPWSKLVELAREAGGREEALAPLVRRVYGGTAPGDEAAFERAWGEYLARR